VHDVTRVVLSYRLEMRPRGRNCESDAAGGVGLRRRVESRTAASSEERAAILLEPAPARFGSKIKLALMMWSEDT
jgi:hypothetical protein